MAKTTVVRLTDDLDGSEADRTIRFGWGAVSYEIDLNAKNAQAFEDAIAPYLSAAQRVTAARHPAAPARASRTRVARAGAVSDHAAVRSWAAGNGHQVADRGRIPAAVLAAFQQAQRTVNAAAGASQQPATKPVTKPVKKPANKPANKVVSSATGASPKAPVRKAARKAARKTPANSAPKSAQSAAR